MNNMVCLRKTWPTKSCQFVLRNPIKSCLAKSLKYFPTKFDIKWNPIKSCLKKSCSQNPAQMCPPIIHKNWPRKIPQKFVLQNP